MDGSFIYVLGNYLVTGKYFEGSASFPIFYLIRSICLNLANWPVPKNFIFTSPGFFSIFISYERANDLYFSGHTGALTIFLFSHWYRGLKKRSWMFLGFLIYTVSFLLVNGVHYLNDILIGFIVGFNIITLMSDYRQDIHIYLLKLLGRIIECFRSSETKMREMKESSSLQYFRKDECFEKETFTSIN